MKTAGWKWLVAAVCVGMGLIGCGPSGECGSCSVDADCDQGLTCQAFEDDSGRSYNLCGNQDPYETCTVTQTYYY